VCHSDGFWPLCSCDPGWTPSGRWCVQEGDVGDVEADGRDVPRTCGDGVVDATEECDDGNDDETDGCTTFCTYSCHLASDCEDGNECTENLCLTNATGRACSSGPTRIGESCDDGNTCTVEETCTEAGECAGNPASSETVCDDGLYCNGAPDICDGAGTCLPMSMSPCPAAGCVGGCDEAADTCTPAGTEVVCRPAAPQCDLAENCDGASTTCPPDLKAASGTACDNGTGCAGDTCNDSGTCVEGPPC
jgi:cysteine-rich repeat protein